MICRIVKDSHYGGTGFLKIRQNQNPEEALRNSAYIEAYQQWNMHYAEIPKCPDVEGFPGPINLQSECVEHRVISEEAAQRYYMLRRIHRHHLSKNDQRRFYALVRQTWISSPAPGDAKHFGYIFWRFAWERSFALDHSVANLKQRHFPVTIDHWLFSRPLTNSDELIDEIHQEMWRSYRRCQWLAQWMMKRGGVLLMPSVMKLIIPGLCIRQPYKK
ncbi:MAG: hypothetical protein NTV43_00980 [Methylococcales bacterium]|nr:hypothetical protein [Methylococcales bacterium]